MDNKVEELEGRIARLEHKVEPLWDQFQDRIRREHDAREQQRIAAMRPSIWKRLLGAKSARNGKAYGH